MLRAFLKRQFRRFGRRWDYDVGYMCDLVDLDTAGAFKLGFVSGFTDHRFGLGPRPCFAAKIIAARSADCGSCLRLVITMAVEAGVPAGVVEAMLTHGAGVPGDMALAMRYAGAVLANDPDLPGIIAACERQWGRQGVAGLAAAVVSGSFYPVLKRGLGHGNSCAPVPAWLREGAAHGR